MNLNEIVDFARNKENFLSIPNYIDFSLHYLEFIKRNLQAVIVSKNENHYNFFQYKEDDTYNVTRPINSKLMYNFEDFEKEKNDFINLIKNIKDIGIH